MNLRLNLSLLIFSTVIALSLSDIQPIDVEPVVKKEQPDFEDDTGFAAADRGHGKNDDDSVESKESEEEEGGDLWKRLTSGTNLDFTHAFVAALTVIIVSELGDKTFFIAAIMAMTNPRLTVFIGAMSALAFMHMLSSLFGYVITYIPRVYTFYASASLFVFFGLKMLREGFKMKKNEGREELEEVQMDLRRSEDSEDRERGDRDNVSLNSLEVNSTVNSTVDSTVDSTEVNAVSVEEGERPDRKKKARTKRLRLQNMIPKVFLKSFTLTFLAEWGDRSQIATVILATSNNVYGIIVGGLLGHALCTGLAVIGGKLIASKISVKTVTIVGGIVFLIFAATAFIMGP